MNTSNSRAATRRRSNRRVYKLIRHLYRRLHRRWGPQGWWPTTPAGAVDPAYLPGRPLTRLTEQERFEICLGAFLTQNTSWQNVAIVLRGLASDRKLSFKALRLLKRRHMETAFRSSGYFRQKASRIGNFLLYVEREMGGRFDLLLGGPLPAARERLLSVNGVGPETADSMLLYAAGRRIFVIDAYTRRIGARVGLFRGDEPYDELRARFEDALPRSPRVYAEYHALIVRLGKDHCRPRPICRGCPALPICPTGKRILSQGEKHGR